MLGLSVEGITDIKAFMRDFLIMTDDVRTESNIYLNIKNITL